MQISDDELNSVPQKIKLLDNNLQSLVSNQTGIVDSVGKLNNILISFHDKIDQIANDKNLKNLELELNSIRKQVEILTELSKGNEEEINNITNILATLNVSSPHNINNTKNTPKTSQEYEPFHVGRP